MSPPALFVRPLCRGAGQVPERAAAVGSGAAARTGRGRGADKPYARLSPGAV